jgi:endogenous inhibitor of DNA gyrase (YacG/DUF329 family)
MSRRPERSERPPTSTPRCPTCGGPLPEPAAASGPPTAKWKHYPFCSDRCRLIDLGRWFNGEYRIAGTSADPMSAPDDARDE